MLGGQANVGKQCSNASENAYVRWLRRNCRRRYRLALLNLSYAMKILPSQTIKCLRDHVPNVSGGCPSFQPLYRSMMGSTAVSWISPRIGGASGEGAGRGAGPRVRAAAAGAGSDDGRGARGAAGGGHGVRHTWAPGAGAGLPVAQLPAGAAAGCDPAALPRDRSVCRL